MPPPPAEPSLRDNNHSNNLSPVYNRDISHDIGDVIQARLWTMMQRSLYDPLSARRLRPSSGNAATKTNHGAEEGVDVSSVAGVPQHALVECSTYDDNVFDFAEDDFDDLFEDESQMMEYEEFEDLLDYDVEQEPEDEFQDLLESEHAHHVGSEDGNGLDNDDLITEMGELADINSWQAFPDTRFRDFGLKDHVDMVGEMSIGNQTMLI
jgi:hypothetical protein